MNLYEQLSHKQQGVIIMTLGIVLLLHALGIIERGLNLVIIATAIVMIVYGALKANVISFFMNMMQRGKKSEKSKEEE